MMRRILKPISFAIATLAVTSCGNPEVDAKKVCDCYNSIDSTSTDADFKKCLYLSEDMLAKYAQDPPRLVRYNRASQCDPSSQR
ncbi:hypothetical protein [Desertivirga arenae]|uniref:hypothetical protein n=1 Tax=Desertivirga arenae TaxID=2810309 RepID=UPI001A9648FC|nr:hypothetical protein [Pedobacter sp. SYSU D00823]